MRISVFHKNGEPDLAAKRKLTDSRLGLPNADNECKSCGERVSQKCEGHFGHLLFPYPVYHPNHVSDVVKILDSLCLRCLSLKKSKKRYPTELGTHDDMINGVTAMNFEDKAMRHSGGTPVPTKNKHQLNSFSATHCLEVPSSAKEEPEEPSSTGSFTAGDTSKTPKTTTFPPFTEENEAPTEQTGRGPSRPLIIDLSSDDEESSSPKDTSMANGLQHNESLKTTSSHPILREHKKNAKKDARRKGKEENGEDTTSGKNVSCKYCKLGEYPKLRVKLERNVQSDKKIVERISLELDEDEDLPEDYLKLLNKRMGDFDSGQQYLLPNEALRILTSLSDEVVQEFKMNGTVSRPESLILEALLIPPNCNRIPETAGTDNLRFGSDKVTNKLAKVLTKVPAMKASKATVMTNRIAIDEMQCLLADYLRLKGAPKIRGSKEPSSDYVRVGKPAKHVPKVSLNNLHKHLAAKVSSFSCRAVLTGDTFLALDEIGIPYSIAQGLTILEMVTNDNLEKMQDVVNNGRGSLTKTGALHYIRGNVKKDLNHCDPVTVEIGDCIGRIIRDGDYVFCNRPPSVHKHSMLGLRVRILDIPTLAINPLICLPLGADFDGDCLAVFIPQSEESRTEVKELMMVQEQMLTSHGGQCTFSLTQDALLAAFKLTSSHTFLNRRTIEQACMSTASVYVKPAIVKSPKGPFWTGAQCFQLSLPDNLNYAENGVLISDSEILQISGDAEWLSSSATSLLQKIIWQFGGNAALKYLGSLQSMLVQWISQVGFSVGTCDAHGTAWWSTRANLKKVIMMKMDEEESTVNNKLRNLTSQFMSKSIEKFGLQLMQKVSAEVERVALQHACVENSVLDMVTAGSKGSIKKCVEQFAFLGLQPYKGKLTHPVKKVESLIASAEAEAFLHGPGESKWEERGMVRSSFADGLKPREFFMHTVAYRETMIHKALRVSEPGYLYKNMMLFARDVCIEYDGTVRSRHGKHVIQFQYGGAKECTNYPRSTIQTGKSQKGSPRMRRHDSVLAGEPVGFLAATAISQPAYQMLLESPNQLNDLAFCPLESLRDTIYSRKTSVLKSSDRRVVLYVLKAGGLSKEEAAIKVYESLQHITLEMLLSSVSINFAGNLQDGVWEGLLPAKKSPWIVHVSLQKPAMNTWNVTLEGIVEKLKSMKEIHQFGSLSFLPRNCCDWTCPGATLSAGNPCLSFCSTTAQSPSVEEALSRIRSQIIPRVMKISLRGDRRIKSVSIVPSDMASEPWMAHLGNAYCGPQKDEIAIEVVVHNKSKYIRKKSDAWHIVQELCGPVLHLINWSRSMPSSIQGIASLYGIEAAHNCIYQRLKSVLSMFDKTVYSHHVSLITDLMTHSGNVIGLNASGFREFNNTVHVSAPITQSLFQNSIKHIQDAAFKGKCDDLSGTLPAICWGKPAPVGTGAKFEILWKESKPICENQPGSIKKIKSIFFIKLVETRGVLETVPAN
ncbi:hypothetical protein GOP47_0014698 [Adiantum capillus-veneris]|uniref:DNA-directed RNA polymerase subunit n=1 Tax=Adiantum capillus-veneris TaxID=13818 RepID=A0A9D4UM71_ADICA|nr:hypothetical protein GOP47_0014698 [Adiantum capillus-veneris]